MGKLGDVNSVDKAILLQLLLVISHESCFPLSNEMNTSLLCTSLSTHPNFQVQVYVICALCIKLNFKRAKAYIDFELIFKK